MGIGVELSRPKSSGPVERGHVAKQDKIAGLFLASGAIGALRQDRLIVAERRAVHLGTYARKRS